MCSGLLKENSNAGGGTENKLSCVIDFEGAPRSQKMTGIGERTALHDLAQLQDLGLMIKTGPLKGTRHIAPSLANVRSTWSTFGSS